MPYIHKEFRKDIDDGDIPVSVGELTYLFYSKALEYLEYHAKNFSTLSSIVAAFECAKLEFYRRHIAPYEDEKIQENGDVE